MLDGQTGYDSPAWKQHLVEEHRLPGSWLCRAQGPVVSWEWEQDVRKDRSFAEKNPVEGRKQSLLLKGTDTHRTGLYGVFIFFLLHQLTSPSFIMVLIPECLCCAFRSLWSTGDWMRHVCITSSVKHRVFVEQTDFRSAFVSHVECITSF